MNEQQQMAGQLPGEWRVPAPFIAAGQDAKIAKPRILQQLDVLERVLNSVAASTSRLENAANRVIGPRPSPETGVKLQAGTPPPCSLDARIAVLLTQAEALAGRLNGAAVQLDSAV